MKLFDMRLTFHSISSILEPKRQIVRVLPAENKLVIIATRGVDVGDVCVMNHLAPKERGTTRATVGRGGIVILELGALGVDVSVQHLLIIG